MKKIAIRLLLISAGLLFTIKFMYICFSTTKAIETTKPATDNLTEWLETQNQRLKTIEDGCSAYDEKLSSWEELLESKWIGRLLYNDKHKILYCNIPKIASTNWKRIFSILNGRVEVNNPLEITHEFVHGLGNSFSLSLTSLPRKEQRYRLQNYKKFLFVRHPFERLVSAYNDKLQGTSNNSVENFQKKLGAKILRLYQRDAPKEVIQRGNVTFSQFVRYLTDTSNWDRFFEPHWNLMSSLCKPCKLKYDYVGKYDTMQTDIDMILKVNHVDLPFTFPPKDNNSTSTRKVLYSFMSQLSKEKVLQLFKIYEMDFNLFGYDFMDWGPRLQ